MPDPHSPYTPYTDSVRTLLQSRRPHHPLPRDFYVSPDIYRADYNAIFYREWIFAGHTFELGEPGQYMTMQLGDYPILIIRGKDGRIRALHNVCRHRGSRVCPQPKGRASRLVCPYHQWAYDLDGTLLAARRMGTDLEEAGHGLKPVHCRVVHTLIFVCVAESPPDFDAFCDSVGPYLAPHNLEQAKVACESNIVERGNWKLVLENNRECYHCNANHPQLMQSFVENRTVAGLAASEEDTDVSVHWNRCESAGFPSTLKMDDAGQFRITRIPLKKGAQSYTVSGAPAVAIPLTTAQDNDLGALLLFNYPSTWCHFLSDHAITFRVLPLGPKETLLTTKWLVHKDAVEGRHYDLDNLTKVWTATNAQDQRIVEEVSQGVSSPAFEPGPFSAEMEAGPDQFTDWYCNVMEQAGRQP